MDIDKNRLEKFQKYLHRRVRDSFNKTKECYIFNCPKSPIKAHSVSEARILQRISKKGEVLYMSTEHTDNEGMASIVPTGKAKATTFPGFCDEHDKIFEPIDANNYLPGDKRQEFLFALRAAAREYTVRKAMQDNLDESIREAEKRKDKEKLEFTLEGEGLEVIKLFNQGFVVGTAELEEIRTTFNVNLSKGRYWKICTETIEIDGEYPIVASSTFKLEQGPDGKIINLVRDLSRKGKGTFFTVFPQEGKTYCLMSWQHKDRASYNSLVGLNMLSQKKKRVIVSNLLTAYVENFAVNPEYWESLPTELVDLFKKYWGASSFYEVVPFVIDPYFSIFY